MNIEKIKIIVQARTNSSRLPNKIIYELEENINFLKILILRLLTLKEYAEVIIATTENRCDDIIEKIGNELNVTVFRGSEKNVLDRYIQCANKYQSSHIIRICSDNPFVDLDAIINLIKQYKNEDYLSYKVNNKASILTHCGFFAELVKLDALKKIYKASSSKCNEHVTNCIYLNPDKFSIRLIPIKEK